ncbi:MAG: Uma2 family endonuclease, partial [Proteobacteria bacterium]|nr:Uma2 family endonuclease [Pseudomonadota bacterium]
MADPAKRRTVYEDLLATPEHLVAEIIDGDLRVSPRPGGPHTVATSTLGMMIGMPFDLGGGGGPGGWTILDEPELHLGSNILVPDLAGWRTERMAAVGNVAHFTLPPDWVCEMLSRSTAVNDRLEKLPIYAAAGVQFAWLVDALARTIEVMRLHEGHWLLLAMHAGDVQVRLP